jgi:hypothetical protein
MLLVALWGRESGVAFVAVAVWADWCWANYTLVGQ